MVTKVTSPTTWGLFGVYASGGQCFSNFWAENDFGVKQRFWEIVPESCIQNGKTPFSLYNSVEYSEYSRLFDSICD